MKKIALALLSVLFLVTASAQPTAANCCAKTACCAHACTMGGACCTHK